MKAASFAYHRAESKEEAVSLLSEHGDDAKVLAGGQSLIPMMNLRLARPSRLIDIGHCPELAQLERVGGALACGATMRHVRFERADAPELAACGALADAARLIGHAPIRSRGTIGGSLAHGDSSSEWCLMMLVLDAVIQAESARGVRRIPAHDFFHGLFTTALAEDELLSLIELPLTTVGSALAEHSRRRGDFAIVAAATRLVADQRLRVTTARIALGGVASYPIRMRSAEDILQGVDLTDRRSTTQAVSEAAHMCAASIQVSDDIHASSEYRRRLASTLVRQALSRSVEDWRTAGGS